MPGKACHVRVGEEPIRKSNYRIEVPRNKKLASFGLLISRKGLSEGGRKGQSDQWIHSSIMMISSTDEDLLRMVALNEKGEDPSIVIALGYFDATLG